MKCAARSAVPQSGFELLSFTALIALTVIVFLVNASVSVGSEPAATDDAVISTSPAKAVARITLLFFISTPWPQWRHP